ncbi:MAG TPA: amino acid adenylation domain-containing protein [Pyrinomonadaceae bacterium]|jgi:amino acid adenylation domain-containing protein
MANLTKEPEREGRALDFYAVGGRPATAGATPGNVDSLRAGFLYQAGRLPHNAALTIGSRVYTYAEAADTARRWATRLLDSAGGRPRRVGILADRSATSYLGVLAGLFAGAGFVPLNNKFPSERTRSMLAQAELDALLVDDKSLPQLRELLGGGTCPQSILLPETDVRNIPSGVTGRVFGREELAKTAPLMALPECAPDDLAYLLFTSGSTGLPKGVPVTHGNVRAFLNFNKSRYRLRPEDRLTQTFDQTFDLSVFDLFMAWESGACVCSMQAVEILSPFRFLERHHVTVWFSVPSVVAFLMRRGTLTPSSIPSLRWSLFCGEGLPRAAAEAWQEAAPHSVLENLYGPTELTIACAAYRWEPGRSGAECVNDLVPIGEVYPHLSHIVVDEALREVAPGGQGELCIAGPQVYPGYWKAPNLSEDRFFQRTTPEGVRGRYFRTGDLVARRGDHYVYLGRRDQQVKVAGYRVELLEVEAALRRAGCVEAVALPWPDESQPDCLVAVVSGIGDTSGIASAVGKSLPTYMVPRSIHTIAEMPLNGNGKIDRKALRQWLAAHQSVSSAGEARASGRPAPRSGDTSRVEGTGVAIEPIIARALSINIGQVRDNLRYQSIPEWDSIQHVRLILALEAELGRQITDDVAPHLCSVAAIRAFASTSAEGGELAADTAPLLKEACEGEPVLRRGLEGVYVDRSTITNIDGKNGVLEYRGYNIDDLVEQSSYEETVWLLLNGELPDASALEDFRRELCSYRQLPPPVTRLVELLADAHPMEALRTGVSALGAMAPEPADVTAEEARLAGVRLIAQIPTLIATHYALRSGRSCPNPQGAPSHASNLLGMLVPQPSPGGAEIIEKVLIIHADHGSNASAFAGRIAVGTRAGLHAAITAAVATFAGPLHGGAIERVLELIDAVGTPDNAHAYVKACLNGNGRVMGFGHRVYHCEDPRVRYLREVAHRLSRERDDTRCVSVVEAVAAAMKPYAQHGIYPNVDLYAGVIYRLLGIPDNLAGAMFIAGRIAGWVAQALEQMGNNVLIRPLMNYVGPARRAYSPLSSRAPRPNH